MSKRPPPTALSAPHTAKGKLQRACLQILRQNERDGELPTSSRFLYYTLKQDGYPLPEHRERRSDQDVIDAVMHLRDAGIVPWEWIVDETRSVDETYAAGSIVAWSRGVLDQARLDPWDARPPFILTESRGVRAALRAAAERYTVSISSTNGQVGGFLRTVLAPQMYAGQIVAYFGDWNPAGSSIEANTRRVLEDRVGGALDWHRLAITPEQAASSDPPLLPKPGKDGRYKDGRPHESYEAEALGKRALAELLDAWLADLSPEPIEDVLEREAEQRDRLAEFLDDAAGQQ